MHRYALVVIDMQRGFLDASSPLFIPGAADTVPACARAIDCCHRAGVPVVFAVRHYRADGSDVERARYDVWARVRDVAAVHVRRVAGGISPG